MRARLPGEELARHDRFGVGFEHVELAQSDLRLELCAQSGHEIAIALDRGNVSGLRQERARERAEPGTELDDASAGLAAKVCDFLTQARVGQKILAEVALRREPQSVQMRFGARRFAH
jgi:hypothetical protein